ncbi:MAG TPA: insulinase family protein [Pseudonocardiaceae bacterium]
MTVTVSDSMPIRIAPTGPPAARLRGMPADVYRSGRASGLAHIRLTLDGSGALAAEAAKLAITARPDWPATAAHTGAGIGTQVLAGTPTLSVTVADDRLADTLDFLCAQVKRLTWAELAETTARAEQAERSRRDRLSPRTTARRLATGQEPAPDRPSGPVASHLTLLADVAGTVEPPPVHDAPAPTRPPECPRTTSRAGSGEQTWYAACWDLPQVDAESLAATELFLFALAGAPFSPLFLALRDDLGVSYGPRTGVQRRRTGARAWLELAFPTAREPEVRTTTERVLADTDARGRLDRGRAVLLSSVLAALDFGRGQADALALGRVVGSPTYAWDVAAHLAGNDIDRLLSRVPDALRTLGTARTGSYHA